MNENTLTIVGLILLAISQILLSFGYDFLMAQRPIDFAHWAMLLGAVLLFNEFGNCRSGRNVFD